MEEELGRALAEERKLPENLSPNRKVAIQKMEAQLKLGDVTKMTSQELAKRKEQLRSASVPTGPDVTYMGEQFHVPSEMATNVDEQLRLIEEEISRRPKKADTKSTPKTATKDLKDLIPAATTAGKVVAKAAADRFFPGAGNVAEVAVPKALQAMQAAPTLKGFFEATPKQAARSYDVTFFQGLKNGDKFKINGVEYTATGAGERTYSARSPAGPFGLEVPTEKGPVQIRIEGYGADRKVIVEK